MNKLFKNGDYVLLEDCRAYDEKHGLVDGTTMWDVARKMEGGEPYRGHMVNRNCDKCVGITPAFGGGYVGLWTTYNMTNQLTVEEVLTRGEVPTKEELLEKSLNKYDEWPFGDSPGMIYCTGGATNYKAGEFSGFYEDHDSDLNTSFWKLVCTREEFEAAKAKRKLAKEILNITTYGQALTMMRAYRGRIQKKQIKVTVENATNEKLTAESTINGDNMNIDIKPKANWDEAPENATTALTTGPDWNGDNSLVGSVDFAVFKDGKYHAIVDSHIAYTFYDISDKDWVVLEDRPENQAPATQTETPEEKAELDRMFGEASGKLQHKYYTPEMHKIGCKIEVGMKFSTGAGEYEAVFANDKSVCFIDESGHIISIDRDKVLPVVVLSAEEKCEKDLFDLVGKDKKVNYQRRIINAIKNNELHGVIWVGDKNEK